jgi:hypothetical protein
MLFECFKRWEILKIAGLCMRFQNICNLLYPRLNSVEMETSGPQNFDLMTIFKEIIVLSE